jgi:S-DNA-T family DNA segregation ATPase FtsK/SpoIIIE
VVDPLTEPLPWTERDLAGDVTTWVAGIDQDGQAVTIRTADVSGIVVAGLAGYGKTVFLNARLAALASNEAVQFVLIDGKGGPDYDDLFTRAWLSAKDDPEQVRDHLVVVHGLMKARQDTIRPVLGVKNVWQVGPSPSWPLVLVVMDEAHTFLNEHKGTDPDSKRRDALARETVRLVEELVRKGRNVGIQVVLATQKPTGDAIPTRIRDNCQVSLSFAQRTSEAAVAVLGADITDWPDEHPRRLVDPAYVGVASMVAQGRPGFTLVRTPHVPDDIADQRARRGAHLVRDPVELQTSMCTSPGTSPTAGSWEESGGPFRQESTAALRNTNPHQMEGAGNLDDDTRS